MRRVRLAATLLLFACRSREVVPAADAAPAPRAIVDASAAEPVAAAAAPAVTPSAATVAPVRCEGATVLDTEIRGSLAESVIRALGAQGLGDDANEVAAHLGRILMWDLDLRKDILPGDRLRALWQRDATDLQIRFVRYESRQLGKPIVAFRFAGPDQQLSFWDGSGLEVPRRLKASPLERYDQITALLKDRPTHKGMDFKTPIGTEVLAPRAGLATRTDWKRKGNGNCLEVRYDDGTIAKFLHLSKVLVHPPARVKAGQLIALTGNTGHSTAPHLHYQLNRGERIIDPVTYHGTLRRKLEGQPLTTFTAALATMEKACPPP
jgi:murein DD-endopeptidase MepM/ murein hydrolase activator NlpD